MVANTRVRTARSRSRKILPSLMSRSASTSLFRNSSSRFVGAATGEYGSTTHQGIAVWTNVRIAAVFCDLRVASVCKVCSTSSSSPASLHNSRDERHTRDSDALSFPTRHRFSNAESRDKASDSCPDCVSFLACSILSSVSLDKSTRSSSFPLVADAAPDGPDMTTMTIKAQLLLRTYCTLLQQCRWLKSDGGKDQKARSQPSKY